MRLLKNSGFQENLNEDSCLKLYDIYVKNVALSHSYLQRFQFTKHVLILYLLIYGKLFFYTVIFCSLYLNKAERSEMTVEDLNKWIHPEKKL